MTETPKNPVISPAVQVGKSKVEETKQQVQTTKQTVHIFKQPKYTPPTETQHRFRKTKVEEASTPAMFKPVSFKPQSEEEVFYDIPQPLKAPERPKPFVPDPAQPSQPAPAQRRLVEKKGFGNEDFEHKNNERLNKQRLTELSSAKAISSDMYFGREEPGASNSDNLDNLKEEASRFASMAQEKAGEVIVM